MPEIARDIKGRHIPLTFHVIQNNVRALVLEVRKSYHMSILFHFTIYISFLITFLSSQDLPSKPFICIYFSLLADIASRIKGPLYFHAYPNRTSLPPIFPCIFPCSKIIPREKEAERDVVVEPFISFLAMY